MEQLFRETFTNLGYYFFYLVDYYYNRNHLDQIFDGLYIGNIYACLNEDILHENQIIAVLNCSSDIPFSDKIIKPKRLSIEDDESESSLQQMIDEIDECVDFIRKNILENIHTLVHCRAGVQRSASVIVGYLMKYKKIKLTEAIVTLKEIRPCVFEPYPHFLKSLQKYEKQLFTPSA
tara:strand:- start:149 stop:679 length:531 start_codon:yes stop_codon:yes gene_type:complete